MLVMIVKRGVYSAMPFGKALMIWMHGGICQE
jgi:hypothetical protein